MNERKVVSDCLLTLFAFFVFSSIVIFINISQSYAEVRVKTDLEVNNVKTDLKNNNVSGMVSNDNDTQTIKGCKTYKIPQNNSLKKHLNSKTVNRVESCDVYAEEMSPGYLEPSVNVKVKAKGSAKYTLLSQTDQKYIGKDDQKPVNVNDSLSAKTRLVLQVIPTLIDSNKMRLNYSKLKLKSTATNKLSLKYSYAWYLCPDNVSRGKIISKSCQKISSKQKYKVKKRDEYKLLAYQISAKVVGKSDIKYVKSLSYSQPLFFRVQRYIDKPLALTFDDGPSVYTKTLLKVLRKNHSNATFCVVGKSVAPFESTVRQMYKDGNQITGHTWSHANLTSLGYSSIKWQLNATAKAIKSVTGKKPNMYRPPYGAFNSNVRRISSQLGYSMLYWSVDTRDWQYRNEDYVYNYVISHASKGSIILMHDIHPTTVNAMKRAIPKLVEMGYDLVTVDQLLGRVAVPGELVVRK